jgi:predicted ATP-grasp superfamily ATP-dependent carboligase
VTPFAPPGKIPPGTYLQEFVPGESASIAFVAASGRVFPLGISRQIIGDAEFGARGFQYAGSVWSAPSTKLADAALHLAETAAKHFGLVGVNGIDFIVSGDVPYPVEIKPRWCASMELFERGSDGFVFAAHAEACLSGSLPSGILAAGDRPETIGKAFVFARNDVTIGDTDVWRPADGRIRDIPRPGSRIPAGRPVCTVFATAPDETSCYAALVDRAREIYAGLEAVSGMTAVRSTW